MNIKKRKKPLILQKYEAINLRLRADHQQRKTIEKELALRKKGFIGEQKVDYYTEMLADDFTVLYDVCLNIRGKTAQMDSIIITSHAIFIIEIKNYYGTITFDTNLSQLVRNDGEKETGFDYPITQAELQQLKLQQWLQMHNLPSIPIYYFIAISEPSTIIRVNGDSEAIAAIVSHGAGIPKKLLDKNDRIGLARIPHQKIGAMLLNECKVYDRDVMAAHGLKESDLLPGIQCPKCGYLKMLRIYNNWHCPKCQLKSRNAHQLAIRDYLLLIRPWIRNSECRYWLKLPSRSTTTRILKSYGLVYIPKYNHWQMEKK